MPASREKKFRIGKVFAEELTRKFGTPIYAYDKAIILLRAKELHRALPWADLRYACKANTNPRILKIVRGAGFGIEAVSLGEIEVALGAGFRPEEISFTCGNVSGKELRSVAEKKVLIHLDSLGQLETFGRLRLGREVSLRVNQGIGAGHHRHVITGGPESKFGIDISRLDRARSSAKKHGLKIIGLEQHIGSNVLEARTLLQAMKKLLETARQFPDLNSLDFGGGFGVPYRPDEKRLDLNSFGREAKREVEKFELEYGRKMRIVFEPGRYPVAEAGTLLVTVTDIKKTPSRTFVGVDSGFNHLIRPALYGSYHRIRNASRPSGKKRKVTIAGNLCESGDLFAKDRLLPECRVGDTFAILNAGAYGYAMASRYNSRELPREILVDGSRAERI